MPPRFLCFNEVDRSGNSIKKILDPTLYIVQLWEYYCSFSRIGALTVALPLKWLGVGENCKVFVILLLMAHWLQVRKPEEEICILELFAGRSRLAKLSHAIGIFRKPMTFSLMMSMASLERILWISTALLVTCHLHCFSRE